MKTIFTEHPHSVNKVYIQLIFFAAKKNCKLIFSGRTFFTHKISPFISIIRTKYTSLFLKGDNYGSI
ncbi:DUF6356 family protein [Legionella steigerwaltii]|uniref:DUF6356 family protein n=1 Tax=Legionella steigerwaltii TaxID=460 RepID=UPI0039ED7BD3